MKPSISPSIDEYIARFPQATQAILQEIRLLISETAPDATETIAYGIPTFDLKGKHLVHFGGYEHHIGFYPAPTGIETFKEEFKPYKSAKGSVQFPLDKPIPLDLIRRITLFRVEEILGKGR
ncbi:MAG: hypothetical protein HGA54_04090 [Actinobacteria bacterium]|nr:hypothetical protein [Actinomycetota bacterium]